MSAPMADAPAWVRPVGRIDASNAVDLDAALQALSSQGVNTIWLDLSSVTYLSSSGMRVLLLAHRRQQARGGRLLVCHASPRVARVLCMAGLDRILDLCDSAQEAPALASPLQLA